MADPLLPVAAIADATPPVPEHAPGSIHAALLQFHGLVGPIFKGSQAKYGKFADLSTVLEAITPPLLQAGLVLTQTLTPSEDDGGQRLITTLTHAGSSQQLSSTVPIPCLDQLLARHHQLRLEVLQRHPLDLDLAANAQLPLALPRLPLGPPLATAPAENPTDPEISAAVAAQQSAQLQRPPGLRLDDQLKAIGGLLALLGLNSNPLHAIGGVVTYLRRYAILSLLCLATEDGDGSEQSATAAGNGNGSSGNSIGAGQITRPQPAQTPAAPAAAQATSRSRRSRSSSSSSSTSAPSATTTGASSPAAAGPSADAQAPAAAVLQAAEQAPAAPAAALAEPTSAALAQPAQPEVENPAAAAAPAAANQLTPAEIQQLITEIRTLPNEKVSQLVETFRQHFQLPTGVLISDYLGNHEHLGFCRSFIAAHRGPAAVAA
jgi:hypothetical protein